MGVKFQENRSKIAPGASWGRQNCFFELPAAAGSDFRRLWAPTWLRRGLRRPPGSILGAILDDFSLNFDVFRLCFCVCCSLHFPVVFLIVFLQSSFSFWFRAQTPDMRKMQHPPRENLFSLGALSRRRRQDDEEIETKNNQETMPKIKKI